MSSIFVIFHDILVIFDNILTRAVIDTFFRVDISEVNYATC